MSYSIRLKPSKSVDLDALPTSETHGHDKISAAAAMGELTHELATLQELLYGAAQHSVLVVVQGRDTAGKDGLINNLLSHVDAMGVQTTAFKAPSADELSRDFLWRVHKAVPPRGYLGIFNRSHYEDVLVTRVNGWITAPQCRQRYQHINHFEQLLTDSNTLLLKIFLHISKEEQEERLLEREKNPQRSWKLAVEDWRDREKWDDYTRAYEAALEHCSEAAPWHVVPADRKWYRNLAVTELLVELLRPHRSVWEEALLQRGEQSRQALAAWRLTRRTTSDG